MVEAQTEATNSTNKWTIDAHSLHNMVSSGRIFTKLQSGEWNTLPLPTQIENTNCFIMYKRSDVNTCWRTQSWFKDGASYCYCAYVLRVSRYSDFLSPMLTNTGIFLRGLKLSGESRS